MIARRARWDVRRTPQKSAVSVAHSACTYHIRSNGVDTIRELSPKQRDRHRCHPAVLGTSFATGLAELALRGALGYD